MQPGVLLLVLLDKMTYFALQENMHVRLLTLILQVKGAEVWRSTVQVTIATIPDEMLASWGIGNKGASGVTAACRVS